MDNIEIPFDTMKFMGCLFVDSTVSSVVRDKICAERLPVVPLTRLPSGFRLTKLLLARNFFMNSHEHGRTGKPVREVAFAEAKN